MHPLLSQIEKTIRKYKMLESQERVLAGVSGGADSVCLALVLKELGHKLAIAHVNHRLRGSASDADEEFTKQFAAQLSAPFYARSASIKDDGGNTEAAGRAARKAFFKEIAQTHAFTKIAVAHTRDDRVETFLLNLLRGAGTEGLLSMRALTNDPLAAFGGTPPFQGGEFVPLEKGDSREAAGGQTIRPLIEVRRHEIEQYLKEHSQDWRTDETNFDRRFARNLLRHEVIPDLSLKFNPKLVETLARTVQILEDEDALLQSITGHYLADLDENGLDAGTLRSAQPALARRVLREALRRAGSTLEDVSFEHLEAARRLLLDGKSGKRVEIPGGFVVAREFDKLVVGRAQRACPEYDYELEIPGSVHIPELNRIFRAEIVELKGNEDGLERVFVDGDSIGPYVRIRNWKPGDYYKPVGLPPGKLKRLFQRARIPRSRRTNWPVFVANSTIIWVASFPVSRDFAPCGRSQKLVAFEVVPASADRSQAR